MERETKRCLAALLASIALSLFEFCAAATSPYTNQPKIVVRNGHLNIMGAEGRNLSLQTSTGGFVNLNGDNLVELVAQAKAATAVVESLRASGLTTSENGVSDIERTLTSLQDISHRVVLLERTTANLASGNRTEPFQGYPAVMRRTGILTRKVNRMERYVNKLRRLLVTNECISSPCMNGGTCMDMYNDVLCICPPNWQGKFCQTDLDECTQFAGTTLGCQNGAVCINKPGSYECRCPTGWFGIHCTQKTDNCTSGNSQEMCGHGVCIPYSGGYSCICDQGWTKETGGLSCTVDINECTANTPHCSYDPQVTCINHPGSYSCGPCPQGYTGNGIYCSDIDECLVNNGGCSMYPYVACINTRGSRTCGPCPPGYQGNGATCVHRGVCEINNGGCHPMARCIENLGIGQSYVECSCRHGYTGNGLGPAGCIPLSPGGNTGGTVVIADPCSSHPCFNGGSCIAITPVSISCRCLPGFAGVRCETRIDPCQNNPCQNGGTCLPSTNTTGFTCQCSQDYTGDYCQTQQQVCGGMLRGTSGVLQFPVAGSQKYTHSTNCAWVITTNRTKVLNVTFTSFSLEDSVSCQYDWLQIHDGHGAGDHMIGRYCGNNSPKGGNIISTHNTLYLWFRSDHSIAHKGFELVWSSVDPVCGGGIEVQSHGTIKSPGSPGKYPMNRDCYWQLVVPLGKRILIHFFTMQIEAHPNCSYDFLEIRDGLDATSPLLDRYCNSTVPPPLTTSGSYALLYFHSDNSSSDYGFQVAFSAVPGTPGCGGLWTTPSGEITSPNNVNGYEHNLNCQWLIRLPVGERIKISFPIFHLEASARCRFDVVEIRDGIDENSPLMARLCGDAMPRPFISSGNVMFIWFKTDPSLTAAGFHIKYETYCGGEYVELNGIIHSPFYPNVYPGNKECTYHISLPQGNTIELTFQDFEMEDSHQCVFDYIEIHDGNSENSPTFGKFCGGSSKSPPVIISTFNHLWLKFKTDSSSHKRGFMANYTSISVGCGGILMSQTGIITSPNHPEEYPPNVDCIWIIRGEPGTMVQLTWQTFSLEGHQPCVMDYVQVFDNSSISNGTLIGQYCGDTLPPTVTTVENIMTVKFHSDHSISHAGFSAQYILINASSVCGGTYYSTVGVISSPGYPYPYPPNRDCTWIIKVPFGQQIKLNITSFELEFSPSYYDYLEIRNGGQVTSPLIGKFCGTTINNRITSMSNQLYLRFVTDSSLEMKGFKIIWDGTSTGCGGMLSSPTGSIQSPNYPEKYGMNAECVWKIVVSRGSKIDLVFADLDLEEHSSCRFDYVEIRDGSDARGQSLGQFCSYNTALHVKSTGNHLWIKFRSDGSNNGRGFHLRYITDCNAVLTGHSGVLESPSFPDPYPAIRDCTWTITAPQGNRLNISFSHFDLEDPSDSECKYDYLEISEGQTDETETTKNELGRFCGNELPSPIASTMPLLFVHFKSDDSVAHNGFRLEWIVNGCGGLLTKPSGHFSSPGYPNSYPTSTTCVWQIKVEWGQSIELTINSLDLEMSRRCIYDSLKVYGGPDDKSPMLTSACHYQNSSIIVTTSGNNALVNFQSDISYGGRGFQASYRSVPSLCGGNFTSPFGSIHSRNYPQNYEDRDECYWLIKVDRNHIIKFSFIEFDVEADANCTADYVNVFDGETESDPMLLHHCGSRIPIPSVLYSTSNALLVRMRTDTSVPAKGFLANYTIACGAHITVEDEGQLEASLGLGSSHIENNTCSWILEASKTSDQITLTVSQLMTMVNPETQEWDCQYSYLEVHDGRDATAPLIGKYCGFRLPPHITSTGSAMFIQYLYTYFNTHSPFRAFYSVLKTACGGELTAEHGAFATPGIPGSYPDNVECIWTISTSPGNRAMLSFRTFDLEQSDDCDRDYVEIREENSTGHMIGVYCGNSIPNNITASKKFWIKFRSDEEGPGPGFVADYSMLHGNELSGAEGQIASPLYPRPFLGMGTFTWRIIVDFGMAISITFDDFHVESYHGNCAFFLKITDGYDESAPVLYQGCSYEKPEPLTSSSNAVYIVWNVEPIRVGSWFLLNWLQVPRVVPTSTSVISSNSSDCGGLFNIGMMNSTQFTSPGYPNGYGRNLNCEWIFETVPDHHLVISVTQMDLQAYTSCLNSDNLQIYDGARNHQEWELLRRYCLSNSTGEEPTHGSSVIKAVFQTDFYRNGSGFSAIVISQCGGSLSGPNGVINALNINSSSHAYPLGISQRFSIYCEWNITVKSGRTIVVEFDTFDIASDDEIHCADSYLLLRNGGTSSSPYLGSGKYCGTQAPQIPETVGNLMFIKYRALSGTKGFKLRYREKSLSCGGHISISHEATSYEISSPNYPNIPPPHIECEWIILAPGGERINLDFLERFDLTKTINCLKAYVEVRDGGTQNSDLIGRYCLEKPGTLSSTGNILYVKFFTDVEDPRNGFKARASIATCGGTARGMHGSIVSPDFPANYPQNTVCRWNIVGLSYHTVKLTFNVIDLPVNNNCSDTDHVIIKEKGYGIQSEQILATVCGYELIPPIQTSSSEVEIEFVTFRSPRNFKGFSLSFETSIETCGADLDGMPSGILESPAYPNPISRGRFCRWHITVPKGRRIRVEFEDLDLAGIPPYCIYKLAFFNGIDFSTVIKEFCGTSNPEAIESTSNTMSVYFWARNPSTHRGFSARYTSDLPTLCEGDLSGSYGFITSPRVANLSSFYCEWERHENSTSNYTFSLTLLNSQIGGQWMGNCPFYSTILKITNGDSVILDIFCGNYTSPKIVANPYKITKIVAKQSPKRGEHGGPSNFTLQYSVSECGGILEGPNEVITSPNFPQNYPPNLDCAWALNYPEGQQIQLKFVNMSLEHNCLSDYIEIRNGGSPKSPLIGRYCDEKIPQEIQSQSNKLWIAFHSNLLNQASGFKIITEPVLGGCGGIMHGNTGEITSPNFPKQYDNNVECLWEIIVEPGYHIELTFISRFQLEGSGDCAKDFVEIFNYSNETWVSLRKACGRNPPAPMNSTENRMKILFRSNNSTKGDGFKAQWSVKCGGVIRNRRGILTSPGYPEKYGNKLYCEYIISFPGEYIAAEFQDFNLEKDPTCSYDNLTAYVTERRGQNPRQMGPYCGKDIPPPVRSLDSIRFVLQTDVWLQLTGFSIAYRVETCGGFLNRPGKITSLLDENDRYFGGLNCTWIIQAPENQVVLVVFESFNLERSSTCSYDYVAVYEGERIVPEKRLAKFCGNLNSKPPVIKSTNRTMVVQFSTDTSMHWEGFKASVSFTYGEASGCGGTKTVLPGTTLQLSSPRVTQNIHYEPLMDCHWLLIGPPQQVLTVEFKAMDLVPCNISTKPNSSASLCDCDYIALRDGASQYSQLIGRYCGSAMPHMTTLSSNQLWVGFKTDGTENGQGFLMEIKAVASPCGSELVLRVKNTTQILSSPNYPNNYPSSIRCHWMLTSDELRYRIDIHFKDMDIEDSKGCNNDWLEIFDTQVSGVVTEGFGESFVHRGKMQESYNIMPYSQIPWQRSRFCGIGLPSDFYSATNQLEILFVTNSANAKRGFQLEYQFEGCNRNFTREQGRILNRNFGGANDCFITIQGKPNHTIALYFNDFNMAKSENCASAGMEIRDGESLLVGKFCDHKIPNPVFSTSSTLSIRLWFSSEWSSERYDMTYVTTDKGRGCGGHLFNYGGRFSSPLYPFNIRNETMCRWRVTVPEGSVVALRFIVFDLGTSSCDTDYINIYDVDKVTNTESLQTKFCGTDEPATFQGASNEVIVQSFTSFNNAGSGWLLSFLATKPGAVIRE